MKIVELKKLKRLYKVTLEDAITVDKETDPTDTLYVTEDTIVKFMLSKGADFDEKKWRDIWYYANYSRGKSLAIYFISFKTRTSHEVARYLIEHEIPTDDIPRILSELTELRLIDDKAYTERAVTSAVSAATKGPFAIKQKLIQRGITEDLAEEKLTALYPEEKQLETALRLAQKQIQSKAHRLPLKKLQQKIQQALVTKGFSYAISHQVLSELTLEKDDEQEADLIATEAEKAYQRFARRYEGYALKQHISQSLARKGFDWEDISDTLQHYDF